MLEMARGSEESRGADVGRVPSELEGNLLEVMPTFTEDENYSTGKNWHSCCPLLLGFPLELGRVETGKGKIVNNSVYLDKFSFCFVQFSKCFQVIYCPPNLT